LDQLVARRRRVVQPLRRAVVPGQIGLGGLVQPRQPLLRRPFRQGVGAGGPVGRDARRQGAGGRDLLRRGHQGQGEGESDHRVKTFVSRRSWKSYEKSASGETAFITAETARPFSTVKVTKASS